MIDAAASLRSQLSDDLLAAMKSRDSVATSALRALLGALDNASAVPANATHVPVFGRSGDVPRRVLSVDECANVLRAEAAGHAVAAAEYERLGRHADAARLRAELAVFERYLAK